MYSSRPTSLASKETGKSQSGKRPCRACISVNVFARSEIDDSNPQVISLLLISFIICLDHSSETFFCRTCQTCRKCKRDRMASLGHRFPHCSCHSKSFSIAHKLPEVLRFGVHIEPGAAPRNTVLCYVPQFHITPMLTFHYH